MVIFRSTALVLAVALAATPLPSAAAAGSDPAYAVRLAISHREPFFHGTATSSGGARCIEHRRVKLLQYRRRDGRAKLVGTGRTGVHGRWTILDLNPRKGYWYRVRIARKLTAGGVCEAGSSRPVQVL